MSSTPINLNKARKAKVKAEKRGQADENAARFGLTKAEKQAAKARTDQAGRKHDGHKRET